MRQIALFSGAWSDLGLEGFLDAAAGIGYRAVELSCRKNIRELNALGYAGALSVEWEDNGMDRFFGARDALEFVQRLDFEASGIEFDSRPKFDPIAAAPK
jgi:sugar phosphate isomerase/epimerase